VDFYRQKKTIAFAGLEPATFGCSGKHTNHYTTKATFSPFYFPEGGVGLDPSVDACLR
jgi:hypothetical protein